MNIARILENVPIDTPLYSPICGECKLIFVGPSTTGEPCIQVETEDEIFTFNEEGKLSKNGSELLFPYKGGETLGDWSYFADSLKKKNDGSNFSPNSIVGNYYKKINEYSDNSIVAFYYHVIEFGVVDKEYYTIYDSLILDVSPTNSLIKCTYEIGCEDYCKDIGLDGKYGFIKTFANSEEFTKISKEEYEAALPKAIIVNNKKIKTI
jgi:hypothetical protein